MFGGDAFRTKHPSYFIRTGGGGARVVNSISMTRVLGRGLLSLPVFGFCDTMGKASVGSASVGVQMRKAHKCVRLWEAVRKNRLPTSERDWMLYSQRIPLGITATVSTRIRRICGGWTISLHQRVPPTEDFARRIASCASPQAQLFLTFCYDNVSAAHNRLIASHRPAAPQREAKLDPLIPCTAENSWLL